MGGLFGELRPLDNVLDHFLLLPPLLVVAPPHGPLVFAFETKMSAGLAPRFSFVAFLPPQSTCEATWQESVNLNPAYCGVSTNLSVSDDAFLFVFVLNRLCLVQTCLLTTCPSKATWSWAL